MNLFIYNCPACHGSIAEWVIKRGNVVCPSCNVKLESNYNRINKNSILLGFVLFVVLMLILIGLLNKPLEASSLIEPIGIVAVLVSYVFKRAYVKLKLRINEN